MNNETKTVALEAHRGVSNEYPENTLAAFRAAKELGYSMIELDTKFTADDKCIFLHDQTINRTARLADGSKIETETRADSLTLDEIREYDVGAFMGDRFKGEKVPTLEEVLDFSEEAGIPLKFDNVLWSHTPAQREIMFSTVEKSKAVCGFTCSTTEQVKILLERLPDAIVHFDGAVTDASLAALAKLVKPEKLYVWMRFDNATTSWNTTPPVNETSAAAIKKIGKLGVWLLTERSELEQAAKLGADIAETDGRLRP